MVSVHGTGQTQTKEDDTAATVKDIMNMNRHPELSRLTFTSRFSEDRLTALRNVGDAPADDCVTRCWHGVYIRFMRGIGIGRVIIQCYCICGIVTPC